MNKSAGWLRGDYWVQAGIKCSRAKWDDMICLIKRRNAASLSSAKFLLVLLSPNNMTQRHISLYTFLF